MLAALAVSWYFSRRVQRSIGNVAAAASQIAAGRYDARVPDPGLGGEFATLALTYNRLAERLEATESTRRRMLADLAHEMRTPLATIDAHLEAVEDGVRNLDDDTLASSAGSTRRLRRLAEDMAAVSRAEEQELDVTLNPSTRPTSPRRQPRSPATGTPPRACACAPSSGTPDGPRRRRPDRTGARQPARQRPAAHPRRGLRDAGLPPVDHWVEYRVADTGDGMAAEHLPHLFDRFYRVDTARDRRPRWLRHRAGHRQGPRRGTRRRHLGDQRRRPGTGPRSRCGSPATGRRLGPASRASPGIFSEPSQNLSGFPPGWGEPWPVWNHEEGRTVIAAGWDGAARGVLVVSDAIKPTSAQAVAELKELGLQAGAAHRRQRTRRPCRRRGGGHRRGHRRGAARRTRSPWSSACNARAASVAMVGDGVNDAAALAPPTSGIAMGTGTDVAIEASDLTLVRGDLRAAVDAIRLSRRTLRTIKGNLFWAFAYNVAALPLAALGLLNPLIAGAAMAFSSVFVVSNSLRLRRFQAVSTTSPVSPGRGARPRGESRSCQEGSPMTTQSHSEGHPDHGHGTGRPRQRHRDPGGLRSPVGHQQERGRGRPVPSARGPLRGGEPGRADRHRHLRPQPHLPDRAAGLGA